MEILTAEQMRLTDRFTIENSPVSSIELMEQAARACIPSILKFASGQNRFHIFCGPGNNGGDGLAIARLLSAADQVTEVTLLNITGKLSGDCLINLEKYRTLSSSIITEIKDENDECFIHPDAIIIDAIFGTGLSQITSGITANIIELINRSLQKVISIDLPSGLFADRSSLLSGNKIIKSSLTLTFQFPKTGLLISENAPFVGAFELLDIGLLSEPITGMNIKNFLLDESTVINLQTKRNPYAHKGTYGHGLLISGGHGKMGASLLAAGAFLRSGAGLLTVMVPEGNEHVIHSSLPEALVHTYSGNVDEMAHPDYSVFHAIGAGPGLGTSDMATDLISYLIKQNHKSLVLDADAINIISIKRELIQSLTENTILTPHVGEFRRLCGDWKDDFEKLELQRSFAVDHSVFIVLKGKHTTIACPDGKLFFNNTGNPGMAKGGSGDVLTGLITGLLTRGYPPLSSCIIGVWIHGLAGDLASVKYSMEGMKAGDLITHLGEAWKQVTEDF